MSGRFFAFVWCYTALLCESCESILGETSPKQHDENISLPKLHRSQNENLGIDTIGTVDFPPKKLIWNPKKSVVCRCFFTFPGRFHLHFRGCWILLVYIAFDEKQEEH